MAQVIGNRRNQIKRNINGGTTAPASAGKGPTTGLGQAQVAPNPGGLSQNKPVSGLSAAPQAGAPAPAKPQPVMPWDVTAANDEASAQKQLSNSLTGIGSNWLLTEQEYGLDPGFNDYASNPYSRAALLQRSYDNAKRGSLNSAGNQLYAGSYVNAQNTNTHDFSLGRNELEGSYARAFAQKTREEQEAQDAYNEAISNAAWKRVQAGLESEPEPAAYGGGTPALPQNLQGTPSSATVTVKGKKKKIAVSKGRKA